MALRPGAVAALNYGAFLEEINLGLGTFAGMLQRSMGLPHDAAGFIVQLLDATFDDLSSARVGVVKVLAAGELLAVKGIRHGSRENGRLQLSRDPLGPLWWAAESDICAHAPQLRTKSALRMPDVHGVVSLGGARPARLMITEQTVGRPADRMTLERTALMLHQVGHAQGEYGVRMAMNDRSITRVSWLHSGWLRSCAERKAAEVYEREARLSVRAPRFAEIEAAMLQRMDRSAEVLDALDQLPMTIAFNSFDPGKVFAFDGSLGSGTIWTEPETMGYAALGVDSGIITAECAADRAHSSSVYQRRFVDQFLFDAYMHGLADAGLDVRRPELRDMVRLGHIGAQVVANMSRIRDWQVDLSLPGNAEAMESHGAEAVHLLELAAESDALVGRMRERGAFDPASIDLEQFVDPLGILQATEAMIEADNAPDLTISIAD